MDKKIASLVLAFAAICLTVDSAMAELTVANIFTDHMVVQREKPVPVWGWATPGAAVTVQCDGLEKPCKQTAVADKDGRWHVSLAPMTASAMKDDGTFDGLTVTISGDARQVAFRDVLVGEVWICCGQSNMIWNMASSDVPEDCDPKQYPHIREIKTNSGMQETPQKDFGESCGTWTPCGPETFGKFSAVAFFYAQRLTDELNVPVGMINVCSGLLVEPWISTAAYADSKEITEQDCPRASQAYNSTIPALAPYAIRGAIWYQGESNGFKKEGITYYYKKQALISCWRKAFGQGDFPFYFVQVACWREPYPEPEGADGWAWVREAQVMCLQIPKTGMAVAFDTGHWRDIHPRNKFDTSNRLALWALAKDYGRESLVYSGPLYKGMEVRDGKAILSFDHVGSGLAVGKKGGMGEWDILTGDDAVLKGFSISGSDKKWYWADAKIVGNMVVASSPDVPNPVAVRYGFTQSPYACNLYNKEALPASPFRTDNYEKSMVRVNTYEHVEQRRKKRKAIKH